MAKKRKLTRVERLLEKHRKNPSPTCHDPKQTDLMDLVLEVRVRRSAFRNLDEVIRRKLEEECE
jgi:hypothetical protein